MMATPAFAFPQSLAEKYRPRRVGDFIGLEKQRRILARLTANPFPSAWLLVGPPGVGKTSMAQAVAEELNAEFHHVPSQKCNAQAIEDVCRMCAYVPLSGGFHVVLVDEADRMTPAAQLALLSKLDSTDAPERTIWFFTANEIGNLESRFTSRCRVLEFSTYGLNGNLVELLRHVWQAEAPNAAEPNLERLSREAHNNVRESLMRLETEMMSL